MLAPQVPRSDVLVRRVAESSLPGVVRSVRVKLEGGATSVILTAHTRGVRKSYTVGHICDCGTTRRRGWGGGGDGGGGGRGCGGRGCGGKCTRWKYPNVYWYVYNINMYIYTFTCTRVYTHAYTYALDYKRAWIEWELEILEADILELFMGISSNTTAARISVLWRGFS